jgi:hypothetical protein
MNFGNTKNKKFFNLQPTTYMKIQGSMYTTTLWVGVL